MKVQARLLHDGEFASGVMKKFVDLVRLQIGLEYRLDESGLLIPYPGSTEQAWFVCYQGDSRTLRFYRRDLPEDLRERLAALPDEAPFDDRAAVEKILGERLGEKRWTGSTAAIPPGGRTGHSSDARLLGRQDLEIAGGPDVAVSADNLAARERREDGAIGERPVAAVFVEGRLVSVCESARENDIAAEAWVRTLPEFRRKGHARQAVAIWAGAARDSGKVPFYSHSADNTASRALLRSLGGHDFARVVAYA